MPVVKVRMVGSTTQSFTVTGLSLPYSGLLAEVDRALGLQGQRVSIFQGGNKVEGDQVGRVKLEDGETLLVVPTTARARVKLWQGSKGISAQRQPDPNSDDDDLPNISLACNAPLWQKRMAHFLTHSLHIPQTLVNLIFWVKPYVWASILAWCIMARLTSALQMGPVFVLGSIVVVIYYNLGNRHAGEASAYSIFNGFRALPGQLQADEIDRQVRHGQM